MRCGNYSAAILADEPCIIENVPLSDVSIIAKILHEMGAEVRLLNKNTIRIDCTRLRSTVVPYELARHIRASYHLLGALLGRFKQANVG